MALKIEKYISYSYVTCHFYKCNTFGTGIDMKNPVSCALFFGRDIGWWWLGVKINEGGFGCE